MSANNLNQVNQVVNSLTLQYINPERVISKFIHFVKYGFFGFLAGGIIETLINAESPTFLLIPFLKWAGMGAVMLYSIVIEKWFNEKYHD